MLSGRALARTRGVTPDDGRCYENCYNFLKDYNASRGRAMETGDSISTGDVKGQTIAK